MARVRRPGHGAPSAGILDGPLPRLGGPIDWAAERWAACRPRVRAAVVIVALVGALVGGELRVRHAQHRWGGPPEAVLVADEELGVGDRPRALRRGWLPPAMTPPGAVARPPPDAVLALPLPEGAVLTDAHLDPRGPSAGLASGLRAVPLPVEEGWGVVAGGWVDVWAFAPQSPASRVAVSRPVLRVSAPPGPTALVGLAEDEVTQVTAALSGGRVVLAHAPPPDDDGAEVRPE